MFFRRRHYIHFGIIIALAFLALDYCRYAHAGTLNLDANLASIHTERWARDSLNQGCWSEEWFGT